ncbi:sporulation protein YunB [Thermaerobacillus caldiproteolyticus]|uniref:Sporulation protein YunB n=1 Tax=Thermaerobacillus caldiproteolyticus TaxID=247480 RepID=A0A7V9Z7T7_9BACL|nr:sporulation protein YunB [Anoxybacillus caldiproteolyticus]MBA2875647.1 sporulation protein YunB [Anoxybacillus caldiproteolyticus]
MAKFPVRLSKKRGPLPFRYLFLLTFVFFILSTAVSLWIINKGIEPTLMDIAEKETKRIANLIINGAINQQITEDDVDVKDLIKVQQDEYGRISSIDFNAAVVNRVLAKTNNRVLKNLKAAEQGDLRELEFPDVKIETNGMENEGIIYHIPLGQATNNTLLGNLGPRIPVRFYVIGNATSDVKTKVEPFGINNALIKVLIHIKVNVQVVIPFATKSATVSTDIPIAMHVIQGEVPNFYNNGGNSDPSFEIPLN